jgi:hypothetical protein
VKKLRFFVHSSVGKALGLSEILCNLKNKKPANQAGFYAYS